VLHTWHWPADVDLTGKRVAIVGTGSSSAQITPALAEVAAHVDLYQRSPTWVFPKDDRPLTPAERRRQLHPIAHRVQRYRLYRTGVRRAIGMFRTGSKIHQEMSSVCTHHLNKQVPDPELRRRLTPDYPLGCKRPTISSRYYPALARENVELIPRAVRLLTANGVVDDEGEERPVDVVVLATGFQPQRFLANLEVRGVGGRRLHEVWGDEPKAIVGAGVPGFPNFFMLYGPNTNGGVTAVYNIECSADVAVRALKRMRRRGARVVDWRPRALDLYTAWLDRRINRELTAQALTDDCTNYYHGASGRNVTQWPGSHRRFNTVSRLVPALALRSHK
jgi:cation diffusion facilitator CzcD-associated flavoprotein CzcO